MESLLDIEKRGVEVDFKYTFASTPSDMDGFIYYVFNRKVSVQCCLDVKNRCQKVARQSNYVKWMTSWVMGRPAKTQPYKRSYDLETFVDIIKKFG